MNTRLRFAALAALATTLAAPIGIVHAADATSKAGASVVAALEIASTSDLYFGSIVPDSASAGKAVIAAKGGLDCDAALTCLGDDVSAAAFTVSGEPNFTYALSLPKEVTLSNGSETMTLGDLSSTLVSNSGALDARGSSEFGVGATLQVAANQAQGDYTGTINVTVEYN